MGSDTLTRREVLASAGSGLGAVAIGAGSVRAQETNRYNVGTASPAAAEAAREAASEVVRTLE